MILSIFCPVYIISEGSVPASDCTYASLLTGKQEEIIVVNIMRVNAVLIMYFMKIRMDYLVENLFVFFISCCMF